MLVSPIILNGCGTLYSESRDKQGQAAKEAWGKVDLAAQIAVPRKNEAALLAKQLEVADSLALARRNDTALGLVLPGTDESPDTVERRLQAPVEAQLKTLAGGPTKAKAWLSALKADAVAKRRLVKFETEFNRFGLEMPACESLLEDKSKSLAPINAWIAAHTGPQGVPMSGTLTALVDECRTQQADVAANAPKEDLPPDTALWNTREALRLAAKGLSDARMAGLDDRNAFRAASAEYDAAAAELAQNPTATRDKVQGAAKKLQRIAETLDKLKDTFSVHFVSEQEQQSIDKLLATVTSTPAGQVPAADSNKAAIALVLFPDLVDQAKVSLADAKKPTLAPLLLLKNLAQVKADAAARDIGTQTALVTLLQSKLDWQTARTQALSDAVDLSTLYGDLSKLPVSDALAPVHDPKRDAALLKKKTALWRATALYLDDIGRLQAEVSKVRYQTTAIRDERALSYAESNVMQWNTLITSSVDQMAEFGAAGIKKEDVIALLNSLTLLWIGVGVN